MPSKNRSHRISLSWGDDHLLCRSPNLHQSIVILVQATPLILSSIHSAVIVRWAFNAITLSYTTNVLTSYCLMCTWWVLNGILYHSLPLSYGECLTEETHRALDRWPSFWKLRETALVQLLLGLASGKSKFISWGLWSFCMLVVDKYYGNCNFELMS